jgi:hypothetical protein
MDTDVVRQALAALGSELRARDHHGPITLSLVGAAAGLLGGWLRENRVTADCDVMGLDPEGAWAEVEAAVGAAAER